MLPNLSTLTGEALLRALQDACVEKGVSDLHFSPEKHDVRAEWRLHGVLLPLARLKPSVYEELLRRVKFSSKLKLNVTNIPQDGQYNFMVATTPTVTETPPKTPQPVTAALPQRQVNVRVATLPTRFGETVTLRFLDPRKGIRPLEALGIPAAIKEELARLVSLPNGLILVTGPTGSGKTTTLYALLTTIIGKERNIITLEDPVEYEIAGIVQSEVDPDHEFTFATGLRSILRHDPDVILVGEIRDLETAQTAVNASLTGHLVLSTLHTNSALESIHRLLSMGVSPYTLAPSLRAVLAQRLVRTLAPAYRAPGSRYDAADPDIYDGQVCLPELLVPGTELEQAILSFESPAALTDIARKGGFRTMKEWGEELVAKRVTTREEVERVCG